MSLPLTGSATALIHLVSSGEVAAADLVQASLDRIASVNPFINAFVDVDGDRALADARRQDERAARGAPRGPLGGLPVTVKSAIAVAGLRCETGSPTRAGVIAAEDATVVSRLRRAGAIVLGTTNVSEMLMGYESTNPLHGRTANPWDLARTPGGSSGGEAAAIATGCSAAGMGSDGGGSIRVPAHFSGICGFKPTPGRIPTTGHQPPCLGPFSLLGVVGPMARTVGDLQVLDRAVAGFDHGDAAAVPGDDPWSTPAGPSRVAFFESDGLIPTDPESRSAVGQAAAALDAAGFNVEPYCPSVLRDAGPLWDVLFSEVGLLVLHELMGGAERELPILKAHLARRAEASGLTAAMLAEAWMARDNARLTLLAEMTERPILLCPVAAIPAFRHGEQSWTIDGQRVDLIDAMRFTQWFNVLGNPAVVVPCGVTSTGLPVGVQVVGRPFDDRRVLAVAAAIERGNRGYSPPPGFSG